jgi:hypothetical protein
MFRIYLTHHPPCHPCTISFSFFPRIPWINALSKFTTTPPPCNPSTISFSFFPRIPWIEFLTGLFAPKRREHEELYKAKAK